MSPFRRQRPDPRQLLIDDTVRLLGYMVAVQIDARRLDAPDTVDLSTVILFTQMWLAKIRDWADES
jgi:hypothetical protein